MTGCQSNQNDQTSSKASTQATSEVAKSSASIKLTDGHAQDETQKKYWTFTINGKMGEKGANETKLANNDQVVFNLGVFK